MAVMTSTGIWFDTRPIIDRFIEPEADALPSETLPPRRAVSIAPHRDRYLESHPWLTTPADREAALPARAAGRPVTGIGPLARGYVVAVLLIGALLAAAVADWTPRAPETLAGTVVQTPPSVSVVTLVEAETPDRPIAVSSGNEIGLTSIVPGAEAMLRVRTVHEASCTATVDYGGGVPREQLGAMQGREIAWTWTVSGFVSPAGGHVWVHCNHDSIRIPFGLAAPAIGTIAMTPSEAPAAAPNLTQHR